MTPEEQAALGEMLTRATEDAERAAAALVEARFRRALALELLGRDAEAQSAYIAVLRIDERHHDALLHIATVLQRTGQARLARESAEQAVRHFPSSARAHAVLALMAVADEPAVARAHFEEALRLDDTLAVARRGLAVCLFQLGEREAALSTGRGSDLGQAEAWPYRGSGPAPRVLVLLAARGVNVQIEPFLDERRVQKWILHAEFFDPARPLPPHDLVVNAIGDADVCAEALDRADEVLGRTDAPVLNPPARVRATGRQENAARLSRLADVRTPRMAEWTREALVREDAPERLREAGFSFPLLVRAPGFHNGHHFEQVADAAGLVAASAALPGEARLVMEFVDTRGADGHFRKYRALTIDGALYPLHLAVARDWKVHFGSSLVAESAAFRAEDAAFVEDMSGALGTRAVAALERVREALGLDYGGIDFGIDAEGRVVVFEANATMVIVTPSAEPKWAYRVAPVERARQAALSMVLRRARSG